MALKNKSLRIGIFVQNVTTGYGVTGLLPSNDFLSIKLNQDNVLSSDLRSSISASWVDAGIGNYSFSADSAMMNYNMIQCIRIPSSTAYQTYSPIIYTQNGYLDTNVSSRSIFNRNFDKVSASSSTRTSILDKTGYSITANSDKSNYGLSAGQLSSVTASTITDKTGYSRTAVSVLDKINYSISGSKKTLDSLVDYNPRSRTIDGMTHNYIMELIAAMVNGKFTTDENTGVITLYKRDNSTPLTIMTKTDSLRSRTS